MHRLVILIPLLFGLVGCAGLTGLVGSPQPATRDICKLLTVAEIEQHWGWPDTNPESEQAQNGPTCGWRDTGSGAETVFRLNLGPLGPMRCEEARNFENSQEIAGIGDWAYYSGDRYKLYVKKGNDCLEVVPNTPGAVGIDFMTGLTELTRLAVSRL